jgi:hypothetical protein
MMQSARLISSIRLSPVFAPRQLMLSTSSSNNTNDVVVEETKSPSRRRRRGSRLLADENIPSYKEFVHRFTVLSLYRNYLKAIRSMPHNQKDLKDQVQREFRANKNDLNPLNIQRALAEGKRRYEELQDFTGNNKKYDGDSWLSTKDAEDPRGRVGQGWPWLRSD